MNKLRRTIALTLVCSSFLFASGCSNDSLSNGSLGKILGVGVIAGGAAYIGTQVAGRGNRGIGAAVGGAGGAVLACVLLKCGR